MKRYILSLFLIACFSALAFAQQPPQGYAMRIYPVSALPATCNTGNGEIVNLTTGSNPGLYICTASNVWSQLVTTAFTGSASSMFTLMSTTQGAIPIPMMTTAQKNAISGPTQGLMVFDTTLGNISYYWGTGWSKITTDTPEAEDFSQGPLRPRKTLDILYVVGAFGLVGVFILRG